MKNAFLVKRGIPALFVGGALLTLFGLATPAFAAPYGPGPMRPGVVGTVASISGTTLTVNAMAWHGRGMATSTAAATTYTIDASNAQVNKNGASSSVSAIAVGDMVMVRGAVSGTNITATMINDGKMMGRVPGMMMHKGGQASSTPMIQGNGEPVVGGSVTAISGNTLTVTSKAGAAYTVDASNATVVKSGATSTIASVATGDMVIVQGSVNGSSVTASSVIDQGVAPSTSGGSDGSPKPAGRPGFMGAIGGFISHLFGFF